MTLYQTASIETRFNSTAYQLLDKIGEGGFGSVYRAIQNSTGQLVAIKFLTVSAELDEQKRQRYHQRFARETLLCAQLRHPNIVMLLDKGICDGCPYAVFEFVKGRTLKQHIQEHGPLPAAEAAQVMAQVLDGLAHAHQLGILHRDIKPANIMLVDTGVKAHVKVLDFGIGTIIDETRQLDLKSLTITDEVLGTPAYSAPEQLRGEPSTLKTDLYVWGLVFLECLTGQRVVSGSSVASILHQQLSDNMVPLPAGILAHPVNAILRRVLEKKAYRRNVQASQLYKDLTEINFTNLIMTDNQHTPHNAIDNPSPQLATQTHLSVNGLNALVERKQITVLSLCLSIKTITKKPTDVEAIDMIFHDFQLQCVDLAVRFGGYHVGTLGDSIVFYFGYPLVNDNHARLCARSALEIISELNKRNGLMRTSHGFAFCAQIGIHADITTCYGNQPPSGEMTNLAMKLARIAQPNQILCSEDSQILLNQVMTFQSCGSSIHHISGKEIKLYSIEGEKRIEALSFFVDPSTQPAFVGRDTILNQLLTTIKDRNQIRCLYICGEAGIGKSRLIYQVRNQVTQLTQLITQLIVQCLPEQQTNALYPILLLLKTHYGWADHIQQTAVEQLNHIITISHLPWPTGLMELSDRQQALTILMMWLNLPFDGEVNITQLTPQQQKQSLFDLISVLLVHNKHQDHRRLPQPTSVLFIIEDLHWADPMSVDFIQKFSDFLLAFDHKLLVSSRITTLPCSPQSQHSSIQVHTLNRLDQAASAQLIKGLFNDKPVAQVIIDTLVSHSDGIPLFIESLVDVLKRKALVYERGNLIDFVNIEQSKQLPTTLRDIMQHKLDGLTHGKETAQLASIIGREFNYHMLIKLSPSGESQVQTSLQTLIAANIIYLQRKTDGDIYIFQHALVCEAAYQGIPITKRRQLHHQLAQIIQADNNQLASQQPHILAHHFAIAEQPSLAMNWFIRAAEKAQSLHSHLTYVNYYHRALEQSALLTEDRPLSKKIAKQLTQVYRGIGAGEIALGRHTQGREALQHMLDLNTLDGQQSAQAHLHLGRSWAACLEHEKALSALQTAELCLKNQLADQVTERLQIEINASRMNVYYILNDTQAMSQLLDDYANQAATHQNKTQRAYHLQNEYQLRLRQQRYIVDEKTILLAKTVRIMLRDQEQTESRIIADFNYAMALYFSGNYQQAYNDLQAVLPQATRLANVSILTLCYTYLAISSRHLQQIKLTENYAQQAQTFAINAGMQSYEAVAKANLAWVALRQNDVTMAEALLTTAIDLWEHNQRSHYPLQWLGRLLQIELWLRTTNQLCESVCQQLEQMAKVLLSDSQQKLPPSINAAFHHILKGQPCPITMWNHSKTILNQAKQLTMI